MEETADKRGKIVEAIGYIETKLAGLLEEKEQLETYQRVDKQRKVCEYAYYDKELKKAK